MSSAEHGIHDKTTQHSDSSRFSRASCQKNWTESTVIYPDICRNDIDDLHRDWPHLVLSQAYDFILKIKQQKTLTKWGDEQQ